MRKITRKVDDIEKWTILKEAFLEKGYKPWQYQYGTNCPEGFHVWFLKITEDSKKEVEVITFNKLIENDIVHTDWRKKV